jgi:hypothetical protein
MPTFQYTHIRKNVGNHAWGKGGVGVALQDENMTYLGVFVWSWGGAMLLLLFNSKTIGGISLMVGGPGPTCTQRTSSSVKSLIKSCQHFLL